MLLVCASLDTHTRMLMYMLGISDNLDRDKVLVWKSQSNPPIPCPASRAAFASEQQTSVYLFE